MTSESNHGDVSNQVMAPTPTHVALASIPMNNAKKHKKFSGMHFKGWQQKMFFYLTTLNLARFLIEVAPTLKEDEHDVQVINAIDAWKHFKFLLRIEEDNKISENRGFTPAAAKSNVMEHGQSSKKIGKKAKLGPKGGISKKPKKFQGKCFNCDKIVVSEVNLVGSNPKEWWLNTGATRHVYSDK
ncbi:hypothetical protein Pint_18238 [Pistacia integerrima]|uniref:Uncharacterized protein n=1 Tax=Pistacia integerrima TaxID=434235 RepID=A0ACC0YWD0_9ROSI|nr:hypothetical protein Pint_18238 [Pistacia integerrima]